MNSLKNFTKIIAVIGPTACGKTSLAIQIAKKFNGELINADSRQVYKYLDIGTAKGEVKKTQNNKLKIRNPNNIDDFESLDIYEIEDVPIHLINIVEPDKVLTLAQYQKLAYEIIDYIINRGKIPILVGGTGLYIDAVLKGYKIPKVKPDEKLRKFLDTKDIDELQIMLKDLNRERFASLNESDRANKRRLMRIIEIEKSGENKLYNQKINPQYKVLFLTPWYTREDLYKKINNRAEIILNTGLVDEVRRVTEMGFSFSKPAMTAISYPIVKEFLDGKITQKELLDRFAQGDRNYARRQITWFKRYKTLFIKKEDEVYKIINKFLNRNNQ
jgi:tRNA dimethylallyltransferase